MGMLAFHRCESLILIRLSLTQEEFAATYRIPVGTLLDWEQRRKMPDATARAYLMVIERDPKAVAGLLRAALMGCVPQGLKPRCLIPGKCRG